MKDGPATLVVVFIVLTRGLAAVEVGDTREAVTMELGQPTGTAEVGANSILFYDRGEVKLREGRVTAVNLVSDEALAARRAAEAESLRRMDEAAEARLARLEVEGRAVYAARKSDARFATLPAAEQLAYWRSFATRYPMVSVEAEVTPLMDRVNFELRLRELQAANDSRLAELEARLAAAEDQAARAEIEAQRNRYVYSAYPYGRPRPHHNNSDHPDTPRPRRDNDEPRTTPPQNPIDADRAKAMAETEEARRRAYNGGTP